MKMRLPGDGVSMKSGMSEGKPQLGEGKHDGTAMVGELVVASCDVRISANHDKNELSV